MAFAPLAIAGAAIGGLFGFLGAKERNKAIERASTISQKRLNKLMAQTRMDSALRTERLSREAQAFLGSRLNVSPEHLGSLDAVALQVDGVFSDTEAISEERDRQLEAFQAEKLNIATEATNQSQNELLAGIQGALGGFQAGAGLGGAIDEAVAAGQISDFSTQQRALQMEEQRASTAFANLRLKFAQKRQGDRLEDLGRSRRALDVIGNVVQFR